MSDNGGSQAPASGEPRRRLTLLAFAFAISALPAGVALSAKPHSRGVVQQEQQPPIIQVPPVEYFSDETQYQYPLTFPEDNRAADAQEEGNKIQRQIVHLGWVEAAIYGAQAFLLLLVLGVNAYQAALSRRVITRLSEDFLASHGPSIRVKHVWLKSDIWKSEPISIEVIIVNKGRTSAKLENLFLATLIAARGDPLPPVDKADMVLRRVSPEVITSGMTFNIPSHSDNRVLNEQEKADVRQGTRELYCVGRIEYLDQGARIKTTAFCRRLYIHPEPRSGTRFILYDDPDYEYQD